MSLSAMIFASNEEARSRIQRRCLNLGDVKLFPTPDSRPSAPDMVRLINCYSPDIALIEFHDRLDALKVEETVRASCPDLAILGFCENWQYEALIKTPVRYLRVIPANVPLEEFREALQGAIESAQTPGPDNVIVFIPAKAGSGASTIALNVTGALANACVKSTILIEADLHSGPAAMYLNLDSEHSVLDALDQSERLDDCWKDLITPVGNFAILPAPHLHGPVPQPSPWAYRRLLSYTRHRYEFVVFDLPEVVNQATEAVVTSARVVYVVCTPEVPSLILARKRCAALIQRGVPEDRLQIVLNRHSKGSPEPAEIAAILAYPIAQVIPNDYKSLWHANLQRRLVDPKSTVGRAFESFAWSLTGKTVASSKSARKLFGLFPAA
jgi:pilus assembly protein CpaE